MVRQDISGQGVDGRVPGVCPPRFTGREREFAALAEALAQPPAVVLVEGEAGIGKSRLIRECLRQVAGGADGALVACCPPFRQPQTLGPLTDALRQAAPQGMAQLGLGGLAGALRPLFPEWADSLPPALEPAEDASAARHRVFAALTGLLASLGVRLLVVEDLHWADEATMEFLLFVASRQPRPVSVVVSYRPEDVPAGSLLPRLARLAAGSGGSRISLRPLDVAGAGGLASSMLAGQQVSSQFAGFLHQHTEGVPLAVEELVRLMADRGDLTRRDGAWVRRHLPDITCPPTIRDAVRERVERLGPGAHVVLRAAAVLADPAPEAMLAAVAGLLAGAAGAGLTEALASGLVAEDGRGLVAFRHVLARQAVYEDIPAPQRRAMHRRAGEALESALPLPLARLALHFQMAGETARWCRYAESAADLALSAGDETSAAALLLGMITGAELPGEVLTRLAGKIPLLAFTGDAHLGSLAGVLRSVAETGSLTRALEAEARFQLGRVLVTGGDYEAARAELERAVAGLPAGSLHAARAMMLLSRPTGTTCPAAEHLRWLRRATPATQTVAPAEALRLTADQASGLLSLGEESGWDEAAQIPEDTIAPWQRFQATRGHLNIGEMAMLWGRYGEARRRLNLALEMATTYRYSQLLAVARVTSAHLDWLTGAWDGLADLTGPLARDEVLHPMSRLEATLLEGCIRSANGNQDRARDCLQQAMAQAFQRGALLEAMESAAALARLYLAREAAAEAVRVTDEAAGIVTRKGIWIWATDLGPARVQALAAVGRSAEAAELVTAFGRGLRGGDAPGPQAGLVTCQAILAEAHGEHTRAAKLFARAASAWQALPRPYDALLARERQAGSLIAAGSHAAALSMLAGLRDDLVRLGAAGDADRVVATLRAHGVSIKRAQRGGKRGYGNQLSPRELDVVRLLVTGQTNRQIAETLVLSPKTVARHLDSAMHKFRVSSRTALAVKARDAGIAPAPGAPTPATAAFTANWPQGGPP